METIGKDVSRGIDNMGKALDSALTDPYYDEPHYRLSDGGTRTYFPGAGLPGVPISSEAAYASAYAHGYNDAAGARGGYARSAAGPVTGVPVGQPSVRGVPVAGSGASVGGAPLPGGASAPFLLRNGTPVILRELTSNAVRRRERASAHSASPKGALQTALHSCALHSCLPPHAAVPQRQGGAGDGVRSVFGALHGAIGGT